MIKYINFINKNKLGKINTKQSFSNLTTLKIGGDIALLYYPDSIEHFIIFYNFYKQYKDYPLFIIGNGSNILASSKRYEGIVVSFKKIKYKYSYVSYDDKVVVNISSGVLLMDIINYFKKINIGGLEKLAYIPGTIGGIVKMNAGAYNDEISNYIKTVTVLDDGVIKTIDNINYSYRSSLIKGIILEVELILQKKNKDEIDKCIKKIKESRISKQPILQNNAGSTFKNPENYKAWQLIDELGLRGYSINNAIISNMHTNFLINKGNCKSDEMIDLINYIKEKVDKKYNIKLECEWVFVNCNQENNF